LKRKIVRRIYGPVKEGKGWMIITKDKEIREVLRGEDKVIFIESLRLRWYAHIERMQNQRMPKQVATAKVEGARKRIRPRSRWSDEAEGDLNIMRIKNRQKMARDPLEWRMSVLEAKVHNGL
jgi:hypothetical protein